MGSSSSKEEADGIKAVGSESSTTMNGGFHLVEIVNDFLRVGLVVIIVHVLAKIIDEILYYILQ